MESLYKIADREIRACIADYLELVDATLGLTNIGFQHIDTLRKKTILLAGINSRKFDITPQEAVIEWTRRTAVPFDLETAITTGVYINIRQAGAAYLDRIEAVKWTRLSGPLGPELKVEAPPP